MKVLVTGGNGQLAQALKVQSQIGSIEMIYVDVDTLSKDDLIEMLEQQGVKTRIDTALTAARDCNIMTYDTELQETLEYNYNFYFSEFCEQQTNILKEMFQ